MRYSKFLMLGESVSNRYPRLIRVLGRTLHSPDLAVEALVERRFFGGDSQSLAAIRRGIQRRHAGERQ